MLQNLSKASDFHGYSGAAKASLLILTSAFVEQKSIKM